MARKGSIAAFIKNIDLLEDFQASEEQKTASLNMLKELAPVVVASGLYKHVTFKNKAVEEIVENAHKAL